jgi:hypothetical protein
MHKLNGSTTAENGGAKSGGGAAPEVLLDVRFYQATTRFFLIRHVAPANVPPTPSETTVIDTKPGLAIADAAATLDWYNLHIARVAIERQLRTTPEPQFTAAQVRAIYPAGTSIMLINLSDRSLNGTTATVDEPSGQNLNITLAGTRTRIKASCAIPIPADVAPLAPPKAPLMTGDAVIVKPGKFGGLAGVVVTRKKNVSVLLLDGMREITGSPEAFEHTDNPAAQPHLTVSFKDEASSGSRNFGAMTLIDTTIHKGPVFIKMGEEPPVGYTKCGWVSRAAAIAYAKYLGARYEET